MLTSEGPADHTKQAEKRQSHGRTTQRASLPNFQRALFSVHPKTAAEHIATKTQAKEITGLLNDFYSVVDEQILDQQNRPLQIMSNAREIRIRGDRQSLTTVAACQQEINKALISQHQPWVRELHKKYLKETKEVRVEETVFERFLLDQVYRNCVRRFIEHVEQMDHNRGKGFVHDHMQTVSKSKQAKTKSKSKSWQSTKANQPPRSGSVDAQFTKINTFDLRDFLDHGGQIKDLINKHIFLNIFNEIQNTIKEN